MHELVLYYIGLLLAILFLVMLAQKIKVSYPIVLVIGGLIIGAIPSVPEINISPEAIFVIFLPPLLYDAAWQTSWKDFWKWRRIIASFAFVIVIITAGIMAYISHSLIPGFTVALGFLLGGIISPPDAVSATQILKGIQVPKRVVSVIEGESLLNDASSLVIFRFAIAAVMTGSFAIGEAVTDFFVVIIFGTLIGLALALIFYAIHRWLPTTASIDTALSFIAPYSMYMVAEHFHVSGVLAVVSGGLFLSNRNHEILNNASRLQSLNVWSAVGFVFNGFVFMLIGLELPTVVKGLGAERLHEAIKYGLIISLAVMVVRLICTQGASLFTVFISRFIKTADDRPGWRSPIIIGWAGMRGVVSLAAALSIPLTLQNGQPFPQRNMVLFITFTVILVTLIFQGLTLPLVIQWFNEPERDYPLSREEQELRIKIKMKDRALSLLNSRPYYQYVRRNALVKAMLERYEGENAFLEARKELTDEQAHEIKHEYHKIFTQVIEAQREVLQKMNNKAEYEEELINKYVAQLDLEEEKLRQQYEW
ncbi:Na+/H+ antiporter [Mucilaginibacter daejeonensis]|uniref:Na+/H+ antiporter n=1 Tax=Mucilaginibacter daejeonensis TaxID=398049 RepID=UPI001D17C81B|nr:Na+/H+ antiporter [Mucilaginibacter daejeonensis]UEG55265.1 Na+/H+ antiporter [Mucilaginibacter daejeonensis]